MKNAKKIFSGWFWVWFVLACILVVAMLIVGNNSSMVKTMAATIMATFMLLPVRDWMYRFLVWAIDFVSSINTPFKDRINPYATYNRLLDPTHREENVGFYRTLKFVIGIINVILALLWMIFQGTSFNVVYAFLHTWEFIFRGKISFLAILIYILLTLGFCYLVYWFVGQILNGELYVNDGSGRIDWSYSWWKILLMVGGLYAKIIIGGLLKCYTSSMLFSAIGFWTILIGFPILTFEVWRMVQKLRGQTP